MKAVGIDVGKSALDVAMEGDRDVRRFPNTRAGIERLLRRLREQSDVRIVIEATGGYEEAVLAACADAGLWIARVNPRQARDFARATGQWAKTDALDARMLAQMAQAFHSRLQAYVPLLPWQNSLKSWLRRRGQVTEALQRTRQQQAMTLPEIRALINKTIVALQREQATIDARIKALLQTHATPALRSSKGLGPVFQATMLAQLPELGHLRRRQIAKLAGIAPHNRDSGQTQGKRSIYGGRPNVRVALYMATLSAVRWDRAMKAHDQQLIARGKVKKVALVACMRKLLTIVNARRRDELQACGSKTATT